jgi:hypothetical protein
MGLRRLSPVLANPVRRRGAMTRWFWLIFGITIFLIPASHLFRFFTQRADIWWTPKALSVPLLESSDRVRIYVRGELLQEQLRAQRLRVVTDQGPVTLTDLDVTLRFNNHDRVRAVQIPTLLAAAGGAGVAGVVVLLSLLGRWPPPRPSVRRE